MKKLFLLRTSPHIHADDSSAKIMLSVVFALVPSLIMATFVFGLHALRVTFFAITFCVLLEYLVQKFVLKIKPTVNDFSAMVTGMLLAFNLPSSFPISLIFIGSFVAIVIAKISFGGLGFNVFNPALVGRVFLFISFPKEMTSWPTPGISGLTGATILEKIKGVAVLENSDFNIVSSIVGFTGGSLGEVSTIALILGAAFLLFRKILTWEIPTVFLLTVFLVTGIAHLSGITVNPFIHLVSGGLILGAFFMATDMVTSPATTKGQIIFAFGCGLITSLIRLFGPYPEGVSFAILIMNAFVPIIDKFTISRVYGS